MQTENSLMTNGNITKQESETPSGVERAEARQVFQPQVDIVETADAVYLVADMPGVDENGADLMLEKHVLTLRGRVEPPSRPGYTLGYAEFQVGDYERTFTISSEIDRDRIEASMKDGVLSVKLPKSQRAATQHIAVKAG